jgi:hypothetical protein
MLCGIIRLLVNNELEWLVPYVKYYRCINLERLRYTGVLHSG